MVQQQGRNAIPASLLKERREYTMGLRQAGISIETIVKDINNKDTVKNWGTVTRRTVERDIARYYRENTALQVDDYDHLDQLRESHISQMEKIIEELVLHIRSKEETMIDPNTGKPKVITTWKPFEKIQALKELFRMYMDLAEVRNWNMGRQNPRIALQQNNINAIFDIASTEMEKAAPAKIEEFVKVLRSAINEMEDDLD